MSRSTSDSTGGSRAILDDSVQLSSTAGGVGLQHFEPLPARRTGPPPHPNDVDWRSQGRSWPALKHGYSILWLRLGGRPGHIVWGSRAMALILHCSWGTEHERCTRLEDMGLIEVVRGSSVAGGAEEDVASEYLLCCSTSQVEQQSPTEDVFKQYTQVQGFMEGVDLTTVSLDLLLDLAPSPDEDRWRQKQFGPVGWLMAADPLSKEHFTVSEMAARLGLSQKAIRTALRQMESKGLANRDRLGNVRLRIPLEVPKDMREELCQQFVNDPDALRRFLDHTALPNRTISESQEADLVGRMMERRGARLFPKLEMLARHPGKGADGLPPFPGWTGDYTLTRRGWELRVPEVLDDWGLPWKEPRVALEDTFTHQPRAGADAIQPVLAARPGIASSNKRTPDSPALPSLDAWRAWTQRRAPRLDPVEPQHATPTVEPW